MGRRANAPVDPVSEEAMASEFATVMAAEYPALAIVEAADVATSPGEGSHVPAFVLGAAIGTVAGALLGTLLSPHTRAYLVGLYQLVSRRLTSAERDKLRFELLLQ